jgi:SpoVK/Ycf46/Vps4 family AAA+-type ATPase
VLLFDEADSFLRDRERAVRSWEVTRVNEFLQQLEAFRGVVACTTNLMDDLDPAALRRFVFKVRFRPLRPEQALALFASTFPWAAGNVGQVAAQLRTLTLVTPGDFAAVARRASALQEEPEAEVLALWLAEEVAVKRGAPRLIGF